MLSLVDECGEIFKQVDELESFAFLSLFKNNIRSIFCDCKSNLYSPFTFRDEIEFRRNFEKSGLYKIQDYMEIFEELKKGRYLKFENEKIN